MVRGPEMLINTEKRGLISSMFYLLEHQGDFEAQTRQFNLPSDLPLGPKSLFTSEFVPFFLSKLQAKGGERLDVPRYSVLVK